MANEGIVGTVKVKPASIGNTDEYEAVFVADNGEELVLTTVDEIVFGRPPLRIPPDTEIRGRLVFRRG